MSSADSGETQTYFDKLVNRKDLFPSFDQALMPPAAKGSNHQSRLAFQRLEFLGDAVLYLIATEILLEAFPKAPEGDLTIRRSWVIRGSTLAKWAEKVDLLKWYPHFTRTKNDHLIADIVEALIAVVYQDQGREQAKEFIKEIIHDALHENRRPTMPDNPKGELQQLIWRVNQSFQVDFVTVSATGKNFKTGPKRDCEYTSAVIINGVRVREGTATTRKEAEKYAAINSLEALRDHDPQTILEFLTSPSSKQALAEQTEDTPANGDMEETAAANDSPDPSNNVKRVRSMVAYDDL